MFNEIAQGSYDVAYRNLSTIAHGNVNLIFRGDLSAATQVGSQHIVPPFVGAQFNLVLARLVHSFYVSTSLGFFNYFESFFPQNTIRTDASLAVDVTEARRWLKALFDHMRDNTPDPKLFLSLEKLVCV
jgi:hypothetical protein